MLATVRRRGTTVRYGRPTSARSGHRPACSTTRARSYHECMGIWVFVAVIVVLGIGLMVLIDKFRKPPTCTQCGGPLGTATVMRKVNGKWQRLCPQCRGGS